MFVKFAWNHCTVLVWALPNSFIFSSATTKRFWRSSWPLKIFEPTCAYARWAYMHRIASVCLSVTWPKFIPDKKSLDKKSFRAIQNVFVLGESAKAQIGRKQMVLVDNINDIGRWAHINVKLHFFCKQFWFPVILIDMSVTWYYGKWCHYCCMS